MLTCRGAVDPARLATPFSARQAGPERQWPAEPGSFYRQVHTLPLTTVESYARVILRCSIGSNPDVAAFSMVARGDDCAPCGNPPLQWRTILNSGNSRMSKKQSKLNQDFVIAFRQGQTDQARKALDQGANPPHDAVHREMLDASPYLAPAIYADMWKLYFEMRGPLNDAAEVAALSHLTRHGINGQAHIARKAIVANTPQALLDELGGQLLADAAASGDPQSVLLILALGVDARHIDAQGLNALHHAAPAAHPEVFKLLVEAGLEPLRCKDQDGKPLLMAVAAAVTRRVPKWEDGDSEMYQRFLARRRRDQRAAADALIYLISLGLKAGEQRRFPQRAVITRSQVATPLQAAMRAHNPLAVEALVNAGAKTAGAQQREFAASFAKHVTASFEDATLDALRIIRLLRPSGPAAADAATLLAGVQALARQRWTLADLEPIAAARRPALLHRLNRELLLAPALLQPSVSKAADLCGAFMLAVRARLPGAVAQLVRAGALPLLAQPGVPASLLRVVAATGEDASMQLIAALDKRKPASLGQGWNALIARAMIAAAERGNAADDAKAGKALWRTVIALRHAHQCETAGMAGDQERRQRASLLRSLGAAAGRLSWDAQWQRFAGLLAQPSVFEAVAAEA
jgi:hypothetical protein